VWVASRSVVAKFQLGAIFGVSLSSGIVKNVSDLAVVVGLSFLTLADPLCQAVSGHILSVSHRRRRR